MSNTFNEHWRKIQSALSLPWNDEIYRSYLSARKIHRPLDESDYRFELDLCLGIDATLTTSCGVSLYAQEKCLSAEYSRFNSISIERYQNHRTLERGDWYSIAADVYLCGYMTEDGSGYERWVLINWPSVKIAMTRRVNRPRFNEGFNEKDGARASFYWIEANQLYKLCPDAFIAQSGMLTEKNASELVSRREKEEMGDWLD